MGEDFSLGDDVTIGDSDSAAPFSPAVVKAQDEIVQSSMASIENAGKITEADKKKYQKKQVAPTAAPRTEEEEIAQMAMDLNDFIQDKVEINNDDGGIIAPFFVYIFGRAPHDLISGVRVINVFGKTQI